MKYILQVIILIILTSCQNKSDVELINFRHYELDTINWGLGVDTCLIEIKRVNGVDVIKVMKEIASHTSGDYLTGDFHIEADTIYLSTKYDTSKDERGNIRSNKLSTVAYEYQFRTNKRYNYQSYYTNNCGIYEKYNYSKLR